MVICNGQYDKVHNVKLLFLTIKWGVHVNLEIEVPKDGLSVGEYVYDTIKKNIINLNIEPGNRISEKEISDILNVSRTPVREAFIKLAQEGLLYVLPQRGTYISYIDLDIVEEARFIRESLEIAVIKLATKEFPQKYLKELEINLEMQKKYIKEKAYVKFLEIDEQFHKTIFKGCNKERTWNIIEQGNTQYKRIRLLSFIADIQWTKVIEQHQGLISAIKEGNEEQAQKVLSNHLKKLLGEQYDIKKKYPQYFK